MREVPQHCNTRAVLTRGIPLAESARKKERDEGGVAQENVSDFCSRINGLSQHTTRENRALRERRRAAPLSRRMYSSISFRKSTPLHNRQLIVYYYLLKHLVDAFGRELTF